MKALLAQLQDKLGLSKDECERAATLTDDCTRLLKQESETETILQVRCRFGVSVGMKGEGKGLTMRWSKLLPAGFPRQKA